MDCVFLVIFFKYVIFRVGGEVGRVFEVWGGSE